MLNKFIISRRLQSSFVATVIRKNQTIRCSSQLNSFTRKNDKITVAISGGVDSSVAAFLVKKKFNEKYCNSIVGLHMSNWNASDEDDENSYCEISEQEAHDAEDVCTMLNIPMHRVSFSAEYWTGVFEPFVEGIAEGRMPNPDIGCNAVVKFGAMKKYAQQKLGSDWVVTGHYARLWHRNDHSFDDNDFQKIIMEDPEQSTLLDQLVEEELINMPEHEWIYSWGAKSSDDGRLSPLLLSGKDESKDQTYFLCGVQGHAFKNVWFPLGSLSKNSPTPSGTLNRFSCQYSEIDSNEIMRMSVRDIASELGLPTASKKDSMGICFIGKRKKFSDFISQYLPKESIMQSGNFVDIDTGDIIGKFKMGDANHLTIGQGAKISGASRKWFVTSHGGNNKTKQSNISLNDLDHEDPNTIFVCNDTHHTSLHSDELYIKADDFNWIGGEIPPPLLSSADGKHEKSGIIKAFCRIRHLQPLIPCKVSMCRNNGKKDDIIVIKFEVPVRAITPGQTAAIYVGRNGLICLGGGSILIRGPSYHDLGLELPHVLHPAGINDSSVQKRIKSSAKII